MRAAVHVATGMPALTGILFRLGVLVLSPLAVCGLLMAFSWIDARLSDRGFTPTERADDEPPAPEPLAAGGVDPHLPDVVPLAEWKRRRATS